MIRISGKENDYGLIEYVNEVNRSRLKRRIVLKRNKKLMDLKRKLQKNFWSIF